MNDLVLADGMRSDVAMLQQLFLDDEVRFICSIPLSFRRPSDMLM